MCAIIGWGGRLKRGQWRQVHHLLTELLIASACRGTDATGFAALDRRVGFISDKKPIPSTLFTAANASWNRLSYPSCLVAHCRAATHGSPHTGDNRNNHPFIGDDLAVVVNGIAANYADVADAFSLRLTSDCDSEIVLRLIEREVHPAAGLDDALQTLQGGIAAAVLDAKREVVWLDRNEGRPTWILKIAAIDGFFACSTREIACHALQRVYGRSGQAMVHVLIPLAPRTVVGLSAEGHLITALEQGNAALVQSLGITGTKEPRRRDAKS